MKPFENIISNFKLFLEKNKTTAYKELKIFFDEQKHIFYQNKIIELKSQNISEQVATIKARQGWVSVIGRSLEIIIEILIKDFCVRNDLKVTNDKVLKTKNLTSELDKLKRAILVNFGEYCVLPDADIIIYKLNNDIPKILVILSIKNSFRERYTETPYWKLKLLESQLTKHIKVFMITPDNDDEISFMANIKKARIVMEYELDGIYLMKNKFDTSKKVKGIEFLLSDLERLL